MTTGYPDADRMADAEAKAIRAAIKRGEHLCDNADDTADSFCDHPSHTTDGPLSYEEVAAITGLTAATLRFYRSKGLLPEPDASPVPDRPRWRRSTIDNWLANRPGRGAPGRPRRRTPKENPK
jgi:predicted DNA-binding transcriptional regulator AlpA